MPSFGMPRTEIRNSTVSAIPAGELNQCPPPRTLLPSDPRPEAPQHVPEDPAVAYRHDRIIDAVLEQEWGAADGLVAFGAAVQAEHGPRLCERPPRERHPTREAEKAAEADRPVPSRGQVQQCVYPRRGRGRAR
jgi:hypothetical protein